MKPILIGNSQFYYFKSAMLTTLTTEEEITQIAAINQQLSSLEKQIDTAKIEERKLIEKRDKLNDEFRKIRQEINELRKERDSLNEKVQDLKMLRDETHSKIHASVEETKRITEKIEELKKKVPKRSNSDLQEELDAIEWKIQTTSLDLEEEKKLIETVKQLEKQLSAYKKIEKQRKKIIKLRNNIDTLSQQGDVFHNQLQGIVSRSQELHSKMLARILESKRIKAEADSVHSAYVQTREKTEPANLRYRGLLEQRKMLQILLKREEETKQKGKQQELKEKIVSEARAKLQKGEELSWDEFQLLSEDDSQAQNQG